jgi:cytidine deaminase
MRDSAKLKALVDAAALARRNAYAPYSGVKIGAAVLTARGRVYSGCNVENSSYGLSCCAERAAIFKAVSDGDRDMAAIAVVGESEEFTSPCGACRQVMAEFNPKMRVLRRGEDGFSEDTTAGVLLPSHFNPEGLARR